MTGSAAIVGAVDQDLLHASRAHPKGDQGPLRFAVGERNRLVEF
jgi:hypothetical protein